jgi:hypothetical protein
MRLGVKPLVFLGRLLVYFFLTYVLWIQPWIPMAPAYTHLLATLTRGFLHVTESISDPHGQVTQMDVRQTKEDRPAIFFRHRIFPDVQSGIPAEWVQANLVLLIPLMLATPARTYAQRFGRLGVALAIALMLQVLDIAVTVKSTYASFPPTGYGSFARWLYQFGDAFSQSMDTQLFPFAIWAGIHFNQLLGRTPRQPATPRPVTPVISAHQPRRKRKAAKKSAVR